MEKSKSQILTEKIEELGLHPNERQIQQFISFYEQLIEWNKFMNLTGITEYEEVIEKHFVDSLSIVKAVNLHEINTMIDIGTGAGFPGIPLKIMFPHLNIILLDSLNKRINFLKNIIKNIKISDIDAVHGRAEELAKKKEYREKFDICVSRAVSNLSTLSEYCIPFVRTGGIFVPYKSGDIDEELKNANRAVNILGGNIQNVIKFYLPGTDIGRSFVVIKKEKETIKKYPRKAGTPSKEPL